MEIFAPELTYGSNCGLCGNWDGETFNDLDGPGFSSASPTTCTYSHPAVFPFHFQYGKDDKDCILDENLKKLYQNEKRFDTIIL